MSIPEVLFRTQQYAQKKTDRKRVGWQPTVQLFQLPQPLLPFNASQTPAVTFSSKQHIFKHTIDINKPIDWHLDVRSGRRFPQGYAKDVDIRSGQYGSAKYVWEINRLLFLPGLAVQYRQTGDKRFLNQFVSLNRSWFKENPYLSGVNWYSNIEVNIRLINWFLAWNILDASALAKENPDFNTFVIEEWLPSIYQHCVYSRTNPSHHSSANNHLISEYAGLFIAASFWQFPESAGWVTYAKNGLEREIILQHSANGINREEAAEYIQFITDFFLIAYVVGQQTNNSFSKAYSEKLKQIFTYIANFIDCKGTFPRYGDEDDGRLVILDDRKPFNNFKSLLTSGAILFHEPLFKQQSHGFDLKNFVLFGQSGQNSFKTVPHSDKLLGSALYEEGHFIFRKQEAGGSAVRQREIYIHADAAPLGYLSIAAHGHADALSFLMHVDGCVFLADPGTYTYHTDPEWRSYFIGTCAHNTVCIDGQNQAFQAGALLWLNHYTPSVLSYRSDEVIDEVVATHNGYDRLQCRHERTFHFNKNTDSLLLNDVVENSGSVSRLIEVLFHLGPQVQVTTLSSAKFLLTHPDTSRQVTLTVASSLKTDIIQAQTSPAIMGWYSDGFYRKQAARTIRASLILDANQRVSLAHQIDVKEQQ